MKIKLLLLFTALSLSSSLYSAPFFEQIHEYVDRDCPSWTIDRFDTVNNWITLGVEGAINYGYDYEAPISRKGVDILWCALVPERAVTNNICKGIVDIGSKRPFAKYRYRRPVETVYLNSFINLEEQYNFFYNYIKEVLIRENDNRPNVGAVLEILSRLFLQELTNMYPRSEYTIGSGVAYRKSRKERVIGELDIIIYNKFSCDVFVIGESKASSESNQRRSLKKAKGQLKRFKDFLRKY